MISLLKNIFFPKKCPACRRILPAISKTADDERVLCNVCRGKWEAEKNVKCSRCGKRLHECVCAKDYLWTNGVRAQLKLVRYRPKFSDCVANKLIHSMKRNNDELVFAFVSEQLTRPLLKYVIDRDIDMGRAVITYVPRSRRQIKRYGYDHAEKLASLIAKTLSLEAESLIVRIGKSTEQKYLNRSERVANVRGTFSLRDDSDVRGKIVFIVDDVITSGASMVECASVLLENGAADIVAVSLAATK